jgi:hypothetical protein
VCTHISLIFSTAAKALMAVPCMLAAQHGSHLIIKDIGIGGLRTACSCRPRSQAATARGNIRGCWDYAR